MQTLTEGYRGLSLVMMLNWDRLLYVSTITVALGFAAWLAGV